MNDKDALLHFFRRLGEYPATKIVAGIFLWLIRALFGPVFRVAYGTVVTLFTVDFITGYSYAWLNPEETPNSRRMFHGLIKFLVYAGVLFVGYQISQIPLGGAIQSVIEAMVIFTEGISVLENMQKIANLKGVKIAFLDSLVAIMQGKLDELGGKKG